MMEAAEGASCQSKMNGLSSNVRKPPEWAWRIDDSNIRWLANLKKLQVGEAFKKKESKNIIFTSFSPPPPPEPLVTFFTVSLATFNAAAAAAADAIRSYFCIIGPIKSGQTRKQKRKTER